MHVSLAKNPAQLPNRTLTQYKDAILQAIDIIHENGIMVGQVIFYGRPTGRYVSCYFRLAGLHSRRMIAGHAHVVGKFSNPQIRALDLAIRSCGFLPPDDLETLGHFNLSDAIRACAEAAGHNPLDLTIKRLK